MENHFNKLERMYLKANINSMLFDSTSISIQEGKAKIGLKVSKKHFHALDAIHGCVYFKLLDDAAYFSVSSIVKNYFVLTTSFQINIFRPVRSGDIYAIGEVKFSSSNLFTAQSSLFDEKGNEVAIGTGNFVLSKSELTKNMGY
tara:strand:- start:200 stop:631 length:432 start_codon:yes stop_codon:yes gene_type:complete